VSEGTESVAASRARTLLGLGRPSQALRELATGLASTPDDAELLRLAGSAHLDLRRPVGAERVIRQSLAADPESDYGWRLLSHALDDQSRLKDAEAAARRAVEVDPQGWRPAVQLALVQAGSWRRRRFAVETAELAVELGPDEAETHWVLGHILSSSSREARAARKALRRALEIDPQHTGALNDLAQLQFNRNRSRVAIQILLRVAAINPRSSAAVKSVESSFRRTLRGYRVYAYIMLLIGLINLPPFELTSSIGFSALVALSVCGSLVWMWSATEGRLVALMSTWWERDPRAGRRSVALMVSLPLAFVAPWLQLLRPPASPYPWFFLLVVPGISARCFWWVKAWRDSKTELD
jgi:Flp pilus assembly protein TadD